MHARARSAPLKMDAGKLVGIHASMDMHVYNVVNSRMAKTVPVMHEFVTSHCNMRVLAQVTLSQMMPQDLLHA